MEHLKSVTHDVVLSTAFKIYANRSADEEVVFIENFKSSVKENFYAEVEFLDFMKKNEAVKSINSWIEETTQEKIKNVIDEDFLDEETGLLLINAIYFKGVWLYPFSGSDTRDREFYIDNDTTIEVKMMKKSGFYNYKDDDELNAQILEIPYKGSEVKMIIILPREKNGIKELEIKLASIDLSQIIQELNNRRISLSLPKFKMEETMDLDGTMVEMGLESIFNEKCANFRGMVELPVHKNACVGKIIQKAFIEVNEMGSEAAAVTVVKKQIMPRCSKPYKDFEVDHPAIFMLVTYQNAAANILFCGRLSHPTY